jgi:hypothetical protein
MTDKELQEFSKPTEDMDKLLDQTEQELTIGMYRELIKKAHDQIKNLNKLNETLNYMSIRYRDELASKIYVQQIELCVDFESATEFAFKAADAFLRIREEGRSYQQEIIEDIRKLTEDNPDNADLGEKIRILIKNKS